MNKLVYILILNWNGGRDTIECVESCLRLMYDNYHVLVIDNGSEDDSLARLRERFPYLEMIQNGENLGFAGGNNAGIRHALARGADYLWLLNNDTVVEPETLSELVKAAEDATSPGIVGSKIYYYDRPDHVWFAGGWIDYRSGSTGHLGEGCPDGAEFSQVADVDYITGCSLMIRRSVVQEVGMMDERFFLLYEETDWNERVRRRGHRILYIPSSRVWHKVSSSIGFQSPRYCYYLVRNSLLFTVKNRPQLFCFVLYAKIKDLYLIYRYGDRATAPMALQGIIDFFLCRFGKLRSRESSP